jgi:succinyl-diaminopimelate desuccinylase
MNPVQIGVIGVGAFGESHVVGYKSLPYVNLAAVCDANAKRAQKIAAQYEIPKWYSDYETMLRETALDAVSVCTPEEFHRAPVLAAIRAGKHVLVEKPLATRLDDAHAMIDAARHENIFLMPGHILRFETRYALVRDQIAAGELGSIVSITARRNRPKFLAKTYLRTSGILEASIHDIDILLWYVGARVKRVRAVERNTGNYPNADATWAILEFENGAVATLENLWLNPDHGGIGTNDAMQVTGTRAIANIDFVNAGLSLWRENGYFAPDISHEPRVRGEMFGALKEELAYFTRCVLENRAPQVVSHDDALHGLQVALAIIESAAQERDVELHDERRTSDDERNARVPKVTLNISPEPKTNFKNLARESEVVALLSDLVAMESVNPALKGGTRGEGAVAEYVARYLRAIGIEPEFQNVLPQRANVLGKLRGNGQTTLIFETHMDTVTLDPMPDALAPKIRDGKLFGRGACDDKASLAAMLYALKLLREHAQGPHADILLASVVDEEVAFRGVLKLVDAKPNAQGAVVGEPTNLLPVIAHKGVVRFRIRTIGHAVHTARLEQGNNAIYQMTRVIEALREKIEPRLPARAIPRIGAPTLCVSTIRGGIQVNMVPAECIIEIDRRIVPGETHAQVLNEIDAVLDELRAQEPTFKIERLAPDLADWALDTPRGAKIARTARAACELIRGETDFGAVGYGSDASKLSELAHIPSIVLGPGDIAQAHTADEWVEIAQVAQAAEIYAQLAVEFVRN